MRPAVRISGRDVLSVTVSALSAEEETAVRAAISQGPAESCAGFTLLSPHPAKKTPKDLHMTGTAAQLQRFFRSLALPGRDPHHRLLSLDSVLDNYLRSDYKIVCGATVLDLQSRTHIMGILNTTPDSFSDGGQYLDQDTALAYAREMVTAGADIIDIGGESTRPGSFPVTETEELQRIIPLIERLSTELTIPLSVDTYKSSVAEKALSAGASIINDISGLRFSPEMAAVAASHKAAVVIMHIKGTPRDMQQNPVYDDVVDEVKAYLDESIGYAIKAGIDPDKIVVDPGIGFGKTLEHNLELLNRLNELKALGRPILLGTSRKKFIGTVLGIAEPRDREDGTAATVAAGILRGARIIRVHDVARMARVATMTDAIMKQGQYHC